MLFDFEKQECYKIMINIGGLKINAQLFWMKGSVLFVWVRIFFYIQEILISFLVIMSFEI